MSPRPAQRPPVRLIRYRPAAVKGTPRAAPGEPAVRFGGVGRGSSAGGGTPLATDGALALSGVPEPVRPARALRLVRPGETVETELRARVEAIVRLAAEVLVGTRPARQMAELAVPAVCHELGRRRPGPRGRLAPPRVLSSWLQRPAAQVAEAGAVVVVGGRVHALALRLELLRGRWRCTALETTVP